MKIIIVAYWHDPRFKKKAGGLIRMFELADNLMGLGHHVTMVLPKLGFPKSQTRARVVAVPFLDLPFLRPLSFHLLSSICLLFLCSAKANLMYVRQMNSFLPLFIAKLFRISSYFEIPNDPYIGYSLISKFKQWPVRLIDRICMVLCDRVVVLSEWSKRRINDRSGIPLASILVFPSGTDTELFQPLGKEHSCQKLGLDSACHYVGFIGSFLAYQGIDTLIDAAPLVLQNNPGTRFLLVGDGPMRAPWEKKAEEEGVRDHFIFTGHVPYREVPTYIGAMDICVAPHHIDTNQASPVKLFDYMAAGRSIVASDIEVVREIIGDAPCAFLTPPNNPEALAENIVALISNETLRHKLGEQGRRRARDKYDRKILTRNLFSHIE